MSTWIEEMNGHHSVDYPTYYEVSQNNTGRQRIILNHLMYSLTINFSAIKGRVYLCLLGKVVLPCTCIWFSIVNILMYMCIIILLP